MSKLGKFGASVKTCLIVMAYMSVRVHVGLTSNNKSQSSTTSSKARSDDSFSSQGLDGRVPWKNNECSLLLDVGFT